MVMGREANRTEPQAASGLLNMSPLSCIRFIAYDLCGLLQLNNRVALSACNRPLLAGSFAMVVIKICQPNWCDEYRKAPAE